MLLACTSAMCFPYSVNAIAMLAAILRCSRGPLPAATGQLALGGVQQAAGSQRMRKRQPAAGGQQRPKSMVVAEWQPSEASVKTHEPRLPSSHSSGQLLQG